MTICIRTSRRISETLDVVLRRPRSESVNRENKGIAIVGEGLTAYATAGMGSNYRVLRAEDGILLSDGFKGLVDEDGATTLLSHLLQAAR